MNKTVLILGANGFIGSALGDYIGRCYPRWETHGVVRKLSSRKKNYCAADLNDPSRIKRVLGRVRPDVIFNCAGGRYADAEQSCKDNVVALKRLFEIISVMPDFHPRVILLGSAAEYGQPSSRSGLIDERRVPRPLSWYGCVKLMQTEMGLMHARQGADVVIGRIFNIFGAGTPARFAAANFSRQIALAEAGQGKPVIHTQRLDIRRDFLDVADVCSALCRLALKGSSGEIYNICSGRLVSLREVLQSLIKYSRGRDVLIKESGNGEAVIHSVGGKNRKLVDGTGWKPAVAPEQSLTGMLDFYRAGIVKSFMKSKYGKR